MNLLLRKNKNILIILLLFFNWRIYLFLIAHLAQFLIPKFKTSFVGIEVLTGSNLPSFVWSFANFDGAHYVSISRSLYKQDFTQAFFPLYPLTIKFFSNLFAANPVLIALIISNLSFLIGLIIFFKLLSNLFSQEIALWSCVFLIIFPASFYFGAAYSEGLFFLVIISSFYLFEKERLLEASIFGLFASATRLVGVFLAPSLIKNLRLKALTPAIIVPIGLVAYMIYLKIEFNDPLYFLKAQSIFGQERSTTQIILLPQVFWRYVKILATTSGLPLFNAVLELSSTIFTIILLILASKKVKKEWLIFSWLAIITPTLTGTLASMPRYILVAFPIYIVLAHIKSTLIKTTIVVFSLLILSVCVILFTRGYWVA